MERGNLEALLEGAIRKKFGGAGNEGAQQEKAAEECVAHFQVPYVGLWLCPHYSVGGKEKKHAHRIGGRCCLRIGLRIRIFVLRVSVDLKIQINRETLFAFQRTFRQPGSIRRHDAGRGIHRGAIFERGIGGNDVAAAFLGA